MHMLAPALMATLMLALPSYSPTTPPPSRAGPLDLAEEQVPVLFERDRQERMTVPVTMGERELRFMVDTGAEHSAISAELASEMGLERGQPHRVISFAGERIVPSVTVDDLTFSDRQLSSVALLAFRKAALGSDGIIGIDRLDGQMVRFDFEAGQMQLMPSPKRKARDRKAMGVILKERDGRMIISEAEYGRRKLGVVIDTGSSITIGNQALRERISEREFAEFLHLNMLTVTGDLVPIRYGQIENVRIGKMQFDTFPVAFALNEPFDRLGMSKRPAIILGMDVLRSFGSLTIDFGRRTALFTARKGDPLQPRDYWSIGVVRQGSPKGRL
ncbi:aspartyl protease family protein [Sphingomicrobium lutaoense]|uniref:Putative aspartyl protease n=1 Tax=Sphingomicrobium lutaoense TaxID=515949 RepID=A0A839Z2G0_9SPHN|nr:aspartyl protease family protein [Sphingomicrobium lutaoense]MBB3763943.1 putative aspartyl protease [Sphingomicrobium lutaoense]